jgi:hypothetical protein
MLQKFLLNGNLTARISVKKDEEKFPANFVVFLLDNIQDVS